MVAAESFPLSRALLEAVLADRVSDRFVCGLVWHRLGYRPAAGSGAAGSGAAGTVVTGSVVTGTVVTGTVVSGSGAAPSSAEVSSVVVPSSATCGAEAGGVEGSGAEGGRAEGSSDKGARAEESSEAAAFIAAKSTPWLAGPATPAPWAEAFPLAPEVIASRPASVALTRSVPPAHKQLLKQTLGFGGYRIGELYPRRTRRATAVNWLLAHQAERGESLPDTGPLPPLLEPPPDPREGHPGDPPVA
jgi:hypothetical protein